MNNKYDKNIYVVFRYDDYSNNSSTELEEKILNLFDKENAEITFGIIPFSGEDNMLPLNIIKQNILKKYTERGIIEPALHGWSHTRINSKIGSEFLGLEYLEQVKKIEEGKNLLENVIDIPLKTFIPPWNTYDFCTLKALESLGFSIISADEFGTASPGSNLSFVPVTCNLLQLKDAIVKNQKGKDINAIYVVLIHQYDFLEFDKEHGIITFQQFSDLVRELNKQKNIKLLSVKSISQLIEDLYADRYLINQQYWSKIRLLLPIFRPSSEFQYVEKLLLFKLKLRLRLYYMATGLFFLIFSFFIGNVLASNNMVIFNLFKWASVLIVIFGIILYSLRSFHTGWKGHSFSISAIFSCVGL